MNGGNPEFFDQTNKICGIVFDRALLSPWHSDSAGREVDCKQSHDTCQRRVQSGCSKHDNRLVFHEQILLVRRCQPQHKLVSPDQDRQFEDLSAAHSSPNLLVGRYIMVALANFQMFELAG